MHPSCSCPKFPAEWSMRTCARTRSYNSNPPNRGLLQSPKPNFLALRKCSLDLQWEIRGN